MDTIVKGHKLFGSILFACCLMASAGAQAWHGGWHGGGWHGGGWHGGGWHDGWHNGWHGGGWGWRHVGLIGPGALYVNGPYVGGGCPWVPGHWFNGAWIPSHRVCW